MNFREILAMDRFSIQGSKSVREYDQNGFLHVEYSPLTRVQVAPYRGCEIPGWEQLGLDANKIYKGYRPAEELSKPETLKSMNGIPIQFDHHPDYAHSPAKETRVGSTGDQARFDGRFLLNSLHITDKLAIDHINDGSMKELSLAYRYTPEMKSGKAPNGEAYDFVMRDINANHLALVEQGRAGEEVLVYDSSEGIEMNEEDKKNGFADPEPPVANDEGGDDVEAILKQMVDAGLEPSKVVQFREKLQGLKNGGEVVEDEEDETSAPVDNEPPVDDEPIEEPMDDEPVDDEPMDDGEDDFADDDEDTEPLEAPPADEEPVEDDSDAVDEEDDEPLDDEPMDEEGDEPTPEGDNLEEPAPAEGGEAPKAPMGGGASPGQVVLDAMKACGLNPQDQNEQRAFAAGVKFGEGELQSQKQPQQVPQQMPQANPMMGKKPMGMDTNAIVKRVEARMNAKFKALKECEKTLGKVAPTAFDSAGRVYLEALKQEGISTKGMDGKAARAAYRSYFLGKKREAKQLAQDAKPKADTVLSKTLNRIQFGE